MYLSQLLLSLKSREARNDLSDRYELHRTLLRAFPQTLPDDERVLYRVEGQNDTAIVPVLLQSHEQPNWSAAERLNKMGYLYRPPNVRPIAPQAVTGKRYPFRLQANPSVKREGKRHAIHDENDLRAWLSRKGAMHGFTVQSESLQVVKLGNVLGKNRTQTWHGVQFDGHLTVTDVDVFLATLVSGVGSAKAFGFGLLSIPYTAM